MRFVLIDAPKDLREDYMDAMGILWDTCVRPFQEVATIPDEMKTANLTFLHSIKAIFILQHDSHAHIPVQHKNHLCRTA